MEVFQLYPSKTGEYVTLHELMKEHAERNPKRSDAVSLDGQIDKLSLIAQGFRSMNATDEVWRNGDVAVLIRPRRVIYHSTLFKNPWSANNDSPEKGQLVNEMV